MAPPDPSGAQQDNESYNKQACMLMRRVLQTAQRYNFITACMGGFGISPRALHPQGVRGEAQHIEVLR